MDMLLDEQLKLMKLFTSLKSTLESSSNVFVPNSALSVDGIINSIAEFNYDPEANVTFDTWFRRYKDLFMYELASQDDAWKVRLLLRKLDAAELDKYCNLILPQNPRFKTFSETCSTLSQHFGDNSSLFNIRYRCLKLKMNKSDDFLTHVGVVNRECERFKLKDLSENQFKSLILICSLQSEKFAIIRTRLLHRLDQEPTLSLNDIAAEYQRLTNLKHDTALVQSGGNGDIEVHAVCRKPISHQVTPATTSTHRDKPPDKKNIIPPSRCWNCDGWHFAKFCPFKNYRCGKCNRLGHKETLCRQKDTRTRSRSRRRFHSPSKPAESLSVSTLNHAHQRPARKYVSVRINGHTVSLQLDTASDITIISRKTWNKIGKPVLHPTEQLAISASGDRLVIIGKIVCSVSFNEITTDGVCYVVNNNLNLLGLDWITDLKLDAVPLSTVCHRIVRMKDEKDFMKLLNEFDKVFKKCLDCCTTMKASFRLTPNASSVFRPKRPVPYASLPEVDAELQRLEKQGVLMPVSFSAWAAPIVVVKKPKGTLRICADFSTGLNDALEQHHYPLPAPDDLFTILNGGSFFAKLDLADAYLQVEVEPTCRELLTINTHRGLFQYTRLPFGVKTAPAIFQQLMDTILLDLTGVAVYLDDILVVAESPNELYNRLATVLKQIEDHGFHLRPEKCQFYLTSVKYLGFIFDKSGRRPDPENIEAIQKMPAPHVVPTLRSFLGLISYYSAFLPSLHEKRAPLNHLLGKNVKWNWTQQCQTAFDGLKKLLTSNLLLTHYDPKVPIIVAADASSYGVGAVILHKFPIGNEKAIMHASKTLTPTEKRYSQIEKEALAIVFAVRRFHKMVYGRHFTILTDNKPLMAVFGSKAGVPVHFANRLQRWALTLLGYDFDIQYKKSEDFGQADVLSRLISNYPTMSEELVIATIDTRDYAKESFNHAVRALPVTTQQIAEFTRRDKTIQRAIYYMQHKWPRSLDEELRQQYQRRQALCLVDGCLMFGDRVVIPCELRRVVLKKFHAGHPGTAQMKSVTRSYAYWPKMDAQIEDLVGKCDRCQRASKNPPKVESVSWQVPASPWSRVHLDFAGPMSGVYYLVLVDAYSKWPEIHPVVPPTTQKTLETLRKIFACHGLPETLVTDNGSQFTSQIISDFCRQIAVTHICSPPYDPQSNGQTEWFVNTFKTAILKTKGEGSLAEIIQRFLLAYRSSPNNSAPEQKSLTETLMERTLRKINEAMWPEKVESKDADVYRNGMKVYFRNYRPESEEWKNWLIKERKGKVIYAVAVKGQIWTRHRNQLSRRFSEEKADEPKLALELLFDTSNSPQKINNDCSKQRDKISAEEQTLRRSEIKRKACSGK
uniref:Gap-Pol polyprotein n=1 Tax=Schistosoma japonicum TaxID=6182 RepID=C7C1Y9_SCHJA|nr:Gap-Pol polyprotein [Schistosoma japonicum]